jgi:formylglycine-generating enzyme required for sulfatase activity/serine/threonine protein kinase
MSDQQPQRATPASSPAAKLFAEYVARRETDGSLDFNDFCAANRAHEGELRLLLSHWERVLAVLDQLGISQTLTRSLAPRSRPRVDAETFSNEVLHRLSARGHSSNRYRIQGEVARGGMGAILRAWDEDLRRYLAMKVVLQHDSSKRGGADARALGRFLEEAQITSQLEHPGIVPVHELGLDEHGRVYFTMRLVAGRDLEQIFELVRREAEGWSVTRAVGVVLKVCDAMAYAHDKRVIHRDLKPANIMVGSFGEVYVMDWGLARVLGQEESEDALRPLDADRTATVSTDRLDARHSAGSSAMVTMDGDVVGTPAYMSPEQARGDLSVMGPQSDVYAVGAILYHLFAGHMPYAPPGSSPTAIAIWQSVRAGPPQALNEIAPKTPLELVAICEKAMARELADRYASMAELGEDIRAYLEGRVVHAYETGAVAELKKWFVRNRTLALTVLMAVALIVAGTTTATIVLARKNEDLAKANEATRASEKVALENEAEAKLQAQIAQEGRARVLRLSDVKRLQELTEKASQLWPAVPERVSEMNTWLFEARDLSQRLSGHRQALDELRRTALRNPVSDASDPTRRAWDFASTEERWQHDTQAELVAGLTAFNDPEKGLVAMVEKRLAFASTLLERTISGNEARARWAEAIASIADPEACPKYGGLEVRPQLGLLPIGRDPTSGLWEFAHLASGDAPQRDAKGAIVLEERSGVVLVLVPGGTFIMGAQSEDENEPNFDPLADSDEAPPNRVDLDPYFMSKYEMTQGQWFRVTGQYPSSYLPDNAINGARGTLIQPVEQVSWDDCIATLRKLALAMPTEAQWEYAARGGTETPWWTGSERDDLEGAANIADQSFTRGFGSLRPEAEDWLALDDGYAATAPVNQFRPNPYGLHGTCGNVWEWCRDCYVYYSEVQAQPGTGERIESTLVRVNRGGCYANSAKDTRASNRNRTTPETRHNQVGVRPARALDP